MSDTMDIPRIIERLRDEEEYFGDFGQQFISNSDIKTLLEKPDMYGARWDNNIDFLKGRYLHHRVLQPELFEEEGKFPMVIVDCNTRNNTEYKNAVAENSLEGIEKPIYLLKKEADEMNFLADKVLANDEFREALTGNRQENEVEEPMVKELFGYWFKGKADRLNRSLGITADFKTTRSLSSFTSNFRTYGYHGQAYIYGELFNMPVWFYVIDKETGRLGKFQVSDETLQAGEEYVKAGLVRLEYYYGEKPLGDLSQYYDFGIV